MGLFTALQKGIDKIVAKNPTGAEKFVNVGNKVLTVITSPIQSISNFKKAEEQTAKKTSGRLIAETLETTITAGALALAPITSLGKTALAKVGGKIAGSSLATKVAGSTLLGASIASPTVRELTATVLSPVDNIARGISIGQNIETLPDKAKENVSKIAIGLGLGVGGVALAGGGALLLDKLKGDDGILGKSDDIKPITPTGTAGQISPILPETTTITKGTQKKRRRATRKPKTEGVRVSQRVNVMVNNSNRKIYKGVRIY